MKNEGREAHMGRAIFYLLVVVGLVYGGWRLVRPAGEPERLSAEEGGAAEEGRAAEKGRAAEENGAERADSGEVGSSKSGSPSTEDPARRQEESERLRKEAEEALRRVGEVGSRGEAIRLKDQARRLLWRASLCASEESAASLRERVFALNEEVFDSEEILEDSFFLHEFQAHDRLWNLCYKIWPAERSIRLEPGFLLWLNGISDARRIREGQHLKVPTEELALLVTKSTRKLWVLLGGVCIREFPVGIGRKDKTPEGVFEIETKIEKPDWYANGRRVAFGDPKNPLGVRWMGFKRTRRAAGYGIHGTSDAETVGQAVSEGCVRMLNRDVEELFRWVPRGTKVRILR